MPVARINITITTALVLRQFLEDPAVPRYGLDLIRKTGLQSGSLYVILARLHATGYLAREREDIDPKAAGRPARYFYKLTLDGEQAAREMLFALSERLRVRA